MQLTRRDAARLSSRSSRTSLALLSSLGLAALALTGCSHPATTGSSSGGGTDVAAGDTGPAATLTTPKGSVLTVSQAEFYSQLQGFVPNTSAQAFAPIGQPAGRIVMQQLLQNLMFEGLAQDQGVAPTDAEVNTQYDNIKLVEESRSTKPFDQTLADNGLNADVIKDLQIKPQLAQVKLLTKGATVSDADVQAFYTSNKDKAPITDPARVHIKRIVVASLAQAQQISKAIVGGQTFESQISQSLDKSSPDGDVPQWVPLDPAPANLATLIKPIKTTAVGAVTPPITLPGQNGQSTFWLVKVVERKDKTVLPLDQVKDLIKAQLLQQKAQADPSAQQSFQQSLRDFQTQAKITVPGAQYAAMVAALTHPAPLPPAPPTGGSPFAPAPPAHP